jgi:hypothetical protein
MGEIDKYAGDRAKEKAYLIRSDTHWVFFETIDEDLHAYSRYLEFHDKNFSAFSINFVRLYLSICSEVDVVAKMICSSSDTLPKRPNIEDYRKIIIGRHPDFGSIRVTIRPMQLIIRPWGEWYDTKDLNPEWWNGYNAVKHHRDKSYYLANLQNVLHSAAGLLVLLMLCYGRHLGSTGVLERLRIFAPYPSLCALAGKGFSRPWKCK